MKLRHLTVGVVLALMAAACGADAPADPAMGADAVDAESTGEPVTIAVVAPLSGFAANYGPETRQGVDLALARFADDAGVEVELVEVDEDVADATQTVQRVTRAVEEQGADIVLGPVFGSSQQAVAPYLAGQGVPMVTFLGGSQGLAGDGGTGIVWPGADEVTARPLGEYAATELGYETIATLAPDYAYGQAVAEGMASAFEEQGGTVAQKQWVPLGTTDMLQYATALDRDVDALAMWLVPADAAAFVTEYRNLGIEIPLLMFQGVFDPTFQEIGDQLQGELGLNEYNPQLDNPQNTALLEDYRAEHDDIPNQTTAFAYTAMQFILHALGETDGSTTVDDLRAALAEAELDTVIGPATFTADGIAQSNRYVVQATEADGRFIWEPIETYEGVGAPLE